LGVASSKDEKDLVDAIERAGAQADYVVLMMHWGGQGGRLITPCQRELAPVIAEAGCDVVVGMHPHVLQGIEYFARRRFSIRSAILLSRREGLMRESLL